MKPIFRRIMSCCFVLSLFPAAYGDDLSDPTEPWIHARAGITTEVPRPFEPLVVDGRHVSMWGRTYGLGGLLPTQITNQNAPMFDSPPRVVLQIGGQRHALYGGAAVVTLQRGDRVETTGVQAAAAVEVQSSAWLEYDGVMRVDLTLSASAPTKVEYFGIEFPLAPNVARFVHHHTVRGGHGNREVPREPGRTLDFAWNSMWWLGDHDRGLSVFTENNFEWSDSPSAVQIQRRDDAVDLRFNIWHDSGRIRVLDTPVTFSIGLHATPSKPLPEKWQARYVTFAGDKHFSGAYKTLWHQNQRYYSYPEPIAAAEYRAEIRRSHDLGLRVCPYFTSSGTSPDAPAVQHNYEHWLRTQPNGQPLWRAESVDGGTSGNVSLCTASSYTDFMTWAMAQFLEAYEVDGLYFDNACPYPCANGAHGCGGNGKASFPIFANREFFKRMYTLVKQHGSRSGRDAILWQHNSRYMVSPALSFVDVYSDGEQFRFDRHSQPLSDITPAFRSMTFTGVQWGAQPCFLPSMSSAKPWLTPWGMAATLPYGNILIPSPGWTDYTAQMRPLEVRREFVQSSDDVRFYRPHEIPPWLQVDLEMERDGKRTGGELVTGAYVRGSDKKVLLVVGNLSDQPGALKFNTAALRQHLGGRIEVTDALTGSPSLRANSDPILRLSIASGTFRLFYIDRVK